MGQHERVTPKEFDEKPEPKKKPVARRGKEVKREPVYTGPEWLGQTHTARILRGARAE